MPTTVYSGGTSLVRAQVSGYFLTGVKEIAGTGGPVGGFRNYKYKLGWRFSPIVGAKRAGRVFLGKEAPRTIGGLFVRDFARNYAIFGGAVLGGVMLGKGIQMGIQAKRNHDKGITHKQAVKIRQANKATYKANIAKIKTQQGATARAKREARMRQKAALNRRNSRMSQAQARHIARRKQQRDTKGRFR